MRKIHTGFGKGLIFFVLTSLLFTSPGYSLSQNGSFLVNQALNTGQFFISLGAGLANTSDFGESQNFSTTPGSGDFYSYSPDHGNQTRGLHDIFIGKEWSLRSPWDLQVGMDFNQIAVLTNSGVFTQGVDALSAQQYSYRYSLLTRQLLAETKLLYQFKNRYHLYALLGLGCAFNKAYNYTTSVQPFTAFTRAYNDNTQTSFSFSLGLGVDIDLFPQWRAGLGYRFADLGKVSLGPASINTIGVSGTLNQYHLFLNEFIAQLTWIL